jgi:hypothetical protein
MVGNKIQFFKKLIRFWLGGVYITMVLAWSVYYAMLSADQKAKYDEIEKNFKEYLASQKVAQLAFDEAYELFKKSDEYSEVDRWWEEHKNDEDAYEMRHKMSRRAEVQFKFASRIDVPFERLKWSDACQDTNCLRRKMERYRSAARRLITIPEVKGVATDDETKQCTICTVNIKDNALPCGHVYCVECVAKMTCVCPTCKKVFLRKDVIKLYM